MKGQYMKRSAAPGSQADQNLKFRINEAYKVARTNLTFSLLKQGCRKIIFTSSLADEGKSTTAVNVAISLAQQLDTKVLLIDCDLRKPTVNRFFKMKNVPGLTDYLGGMCAADDLIRETESPNLSVIPSGTTVPNPAELLTSAQMADLIRRMEAQFDYIVMDTPPANIVVDALALAPRADGYVIVVKEGESTQPELRKTVAALEKANAKILGVILNGAKESVKTYYRYHYERHE